MRALYLQQLGPQNTFCKNALEIGLWAFALGLRAMGFGLWALGILRMGLRGRAEERC